MNDFEQEKLADEVAGLHEEVAALSHMMHCCCNCDCAEAEEEEEAGEEE